MTLLELVVLAGCAVAVVLSGLRWVRVAQREHYLPGSVTRFAARWWRARPESSALAVLSVLAGLSATAWRWPALITAAVVGIGPLGLRVRGTTSQLVWTRRCRKVAALSAALAVVPVLMGGLLGGLGVAAIVAGFTALAVAPLVDLALFALAPLERRLATRFVETAQAKLARIAPSVVAITGSYGKTSTKGYLAHLLAGRFNVLASPKSYNNQAGLARTVNELLSPGTEVLIAEMGTYGPGEIAAMCSWMHPTVSVLTAIGPVHLERFKSLEVTTRAKAEIAGGAAVVVCNVDDPRLAALANELTARGQRVLRASAGSPAPGTPPDVIVRGLAGGLDVEVEGAALGLVELPQGANVAAASNVACALAAAMALGVAPGELLGPLASLPVAENRLARTVSARGVVVLDDTYNANPAGGRLALEELARQGSGGHKVVVTPGMIELGPLQFEENAAFAAAALAVADTLVIVKRTNRSALLAGAAQAGAGRTVVLEGREQAVVWVREHLLGGDAVLYENDLPDHYP